MVYEIVNPEDFQRVLGKRIAEYAPHADDETFGNANSLYLASRNGCTVFGILMTRLEFLPREEVREYLRIRKIMEYCKKKRIPYDPDYSGYIDEEEEEGFYRHTRLQEFRKASRILGFKPSQLLDYVGKEDGSLGEFQYTLDIDVLEDGHLDSSSGDLIKMLISSIRKIKPDVTFIPCREEFHRDHKEAFRAIPYACWRAGRPSNQELGKPHLVERVVEYEIMSRMKNPTHLVAVDDSTLAQSRRALQLYQSQLKRDPTYLTRWEEKLRERGGLIGKKHAEVFRLSAPEQILATID